MNIRIILMSFLTVVFVVGTGFIPAFASPQNNLLSIKNDLVTIEVNRYLGRQSKQTLTPVPVQDAEEIRQYLIDLYDAQQRNDRQAILYYETLLIEKGIIDDNDQIVYARDNGVHLRTQLMTLGHHTMLIDENISNSFCFFNAIGEGLVAWWLAVRVLEGIARILRNISSIIVALILFLTLLPFFVLTMLITNLIPFRILSPVGVLFLRNGTISCLGRNGFQRITVGAEGYGVNLSGFTGITINIPPINDRKSFLFISGFALKAEGELP